MDAATYADDASPFYASSYRASSSSFALSGECPAHISGRVEQGALCPEEAHQADAGGQEGGQPFTGVPANVSVRDEAGGKGEHGHPFRCRQRAWPSQGCALGSGKCPPSAVDPVEVVFTTICCKVEGVHIAIPDIGSRIPCTDAGSDQHPSASSKEGRLGQEAHRHHWCRRRCTGDLRRRDGRAGGQGRRGAAKGRKCPTPSGGLEPGRHQPGGPVSQCREVGAKAQEAKNQRNPRIRRRGCGWSARFLSFYTAFCQGRRAVTLEYDRQRPDPCGCAPDVCLLWNHSALQESTFLSPWAAIESASDLAHSLGIYAPVRVDEIVFVKAPSCPKTVRFDANVLVFQGKDDGKFRPHWTGLNDCIQNKGYVESPASAASQQVPGSPRQVASAGSPNSLHFLDRRLPAEIPGYIHHLQHLWRDELARVPTGQPYRLRSWYIHHVHQQVWKRPRLLDLFGDGTFWHRDLLAHWRDQLHHDEVLNVAVVFPAPRALQQAQPVHADVILVQGSPNFCGGLTTVFPPGADAETSYTWAASYPRHVGGVGILVGVEAEQYLQAHACDVFHGGIHIPTTTAPSHWMSNGHSFVAIFQDLHGGAGLEALLSPPPSTRAAAVDSVPPSSSVPASQPHGIVEELSEEAEESSPLAESSFDEEELQGVQVYQLGRPMHHCFLRWRTYNVILFDLLHSIGLHRDLAVGYHPPLVRLVDQHPSEEVVILQRVGDIPAASTARLVLVDFVFMVDAHGAGEFLREVRLLPPALTRTGLIQAFNLQATCASPSGDRCHISLNNIPSSAADATTRELAHGSYLRILIPRSDDLQKSSRSTKRPVLSCHPDQEQASSSSRARTTPSSGSAQLPHDAASFLQVQDGQGQDTLPSEVKLICNSATTSSLALTHRPIGQRSALRGRPRLVNRRDWILQTKMAFLERARTLLEAHEPVLTVVSWYLHHARYQRNSESRILHLDQNFDWWFDDLCDLWADTMDPHQDASVYFVHPVPPGDASTVAPCHFLLVQGFGEGVPILLSALFEHAVHRRVWSFAAILPAVSSSDEVWEVMGIQRWCQQRPCLLHVAGTIVPQHDLVLLQPGDGALVTILPHQIAPPLEEPDDASMMQTGRSAASATASSQEAHGRDAVLDSAVLDGPELHVPLPAPAHMRWQDEVADYFPNLALVECEDEGPILYLWTWYIDHMDFQICTEPRIVRVGPSRQDWLRQIYEPWLSVLRADATTHVEVVHAHPPPDSLRIETLHLMIEQHPSEPRAAVVLSTVFHGDRVDRIRQVAYSVPRWLCTEDLIDILQINHICEIQKCSARAGRIPFEQFVRHDIPSALSIEVHVKPVLCLGDERAASSQELFVPRPVLPVTGGILMQTTRRWHRRGSHSGTAITSQPQDHIADEHLRAPGSFDACAPQPVPPLPFMAPHWPTTWTTLEDVWTFFFATQAHHPDTQIQAEVWYSDHQRRPWSESGRAVALGADLAQWPSRILAVWQDWFLAESPFEIVVVHPVPLGANEGVHVHVLVVQQPLPHSKSIMLTVMDQFTDPWAPGLISIVVPNAVDHWMLLHCAVVEFQCPPIVATTRCFSFWGNTDLSAGNLIPVRHGMCFTVTVEQVPQAQAIGLNDAAPPAQLQATEAASFLQLKAMRHRVQPFADCIQEQATALQSTLDRVGRIAADETAALRPLATGCSAAQSVEPDILISTSMRRSPVTISLAASLVPKGDLDMPEYKDHLSTLEWLHDANWELTCRSVEPSFLPLPEGMHVPLEAYSAMQDAHLVPPSGPARWELYVDGATSSTSAAWSVIVIQASEGTTSFHGQLSGLVDLSPSSPLWLGAHCLDNIAAEFVATLVALHAIHSGVFQGGVVLRPDLRLSKLIASQECTTSFNPLLAKLIRLHSWWLGDALQVCEVRGHQHHPWNELADRVAKFALLQPSDSTLDFLRPLHLLAMESQDADWAWLQSCPHPLLAAFPPLCDGQVMQFPPSLRKASIPMPAPICKGSSGMATWTLDGRLVTANVLALDTHVSQQEHGRRIGVRTQRLDAQWHQQRIFMVGLQEARTSRGVFHTEHYQLWSSGGAGPAAGRLGCELWCHRTIAIASTDDGRKLTLANFKVVVQHADERRLLLSALRMRHCPLQLQFFTLLVFTAVPRVTFPRFRC